MTVAVTLRHDLMSFDDVKTKTNVKLLNKLFYELFARTIQTVQSFRIYMMCVESLFGRSCPKT